MEKWRKVFGAGITAALLASLFTVGSASTVLAANTSAGGGTVLPGGTSPAGSISFGEDNTAQPYDQFGDGSFTVIATDSAGGATVSFAASSVPVVTTVHGVGSGTAIVDVTGHLIVTISGTDDTKLDAFTVSGLKIAATVAAPKGTVHLTASADTVGLGAAGLVPASGVLSAGIVVGDTSAAVTLDGGSPAFTKSGVACGGGTTGNVNIAANGVAVAESVVAEAGTNGTTIVYNNSGTGFTGAHPVGTAVTQQTCASAFPSFATVGDAMTVKALDATATWNAGVSRQTGSRVQATLGVFDALFASGTTVTFTIATPGVTYSTNNSTIRLPVMSAGLVTALPTLSADLKSLTFTLARATVANDYLYPNYPQYDVAAGTPAGTAVDINVTNSTGVAVVTNPVTIAYIGNIVVGVVTVPNVLIATTNQSAGVIKLTETAAGSFNDSANIEVCLDSPTAGASWAAGTSFWAVVTAGDLKLNVAGLPATQGLLAFDGPYCLQILDYTPSTVASTIEIHTGSTTAPAADGPRINVWTSASPGPIFADVYSGASTVAQNVIIANAVFSGSPSAVALSQPIIVPGGIAQAGGNIQITEGAPGAFYNGQMFNLCIQDQAFNQNTQVFWSNPQGANAPVVTTNNSTSSLVAHYYAWNSGSNCLSIRVDSGSLTTLGVITISNLKFDVVSDAVLGPVFVRVYSSNNLDQSSLGSALDQTVSNAKVAKPVAMSSGTALGVTTTGPFTTSTKVAKLNKYVTWKFSGGAALAGQKVEIWVYTKGANGVWGAPARLTSRIADSAGNVYFYWRSSSAKWISVQARYSGSSAPARQARWVK